MIRNAKVDANQAEIVAAIRKMGGFVVITSQLKKAFDILVGYKGQTFIIEIKDGSKPESQRRLTDGELECKMGFSKVGIKYHVVESVEDAIRLLNGS